MSLATAAAERMGLFAPFESIALDTYVASAAPQSAPAVVIVTITDDDYMNPALFGGRSPLDSQLVRQLVEKILNGKPAVVGVDVTTADAGYQTIDEVTVNPQVVWVRAAIPNVTGEDQSEPHWRLDRVLGRDAAPDDPRSGISLFPKDADGFVRRYYRRPALTTDVGSVAPASLFWATVQKYCAAVSDSQCSRIRDDAATASSESRWFNFAGDRYKFRKIAAGAIDAVPPDDFRDKIVLLGGSFAEARDLYSTPMGPVAGVDLTAFAIASELQNGGITAANHVVMFVVDLIMAATVVSLSWLWPPGSRLNAIAIPAAIVLFAVAGSYVAFRALGSWASFIPLGVGIWIEQLYHSAHEAKHARAQLEEYRRRYGAL